MRINEIEIPDTIDGKPTRNSLGKLIHPTIEGIRNFWRWFGDSKVLDSQGRPLVVYHGTIADFEYFDNSKTGSNDRGMWGRGHYFSSVSNNANSYALRQGDESQVILAYVSIKNPLVLKTGNDLIIRLPDGTNYKDFVGPNLDGTKIKNIAISGNHDGVIQFRPNGMIGDIVAYNSNQIKSAIGNNGNFSVSSNKITEIGFAHELGELNIPHSEIVAKSVKDGTIFGKPVRLFTSGESKLYFFEKNEKISALVLLVNNSIRAIKSFNKEKGSVFALVNYLVNIKNMKLKIGADEPLTPEGFQWLLKLISANSGLKVRDQSGNTVDPEKLKSEWDQSKISMGTQSGPTELTISESGAKWKTKLQMNEKRMIPFVYFKC